MSFGLVPLNQWVATTNSIVYSEVFVIHHNLNTIIYEYANYEVIYILYKGIYFFQ